KSKQFNKGIEQLVQKVAIQLYKGHRFEANIIGAVGELQYEVFQYRMKNENNVEVVLETIGERITRCIHNEKEEESQYGERKLLVREREDNFVVLFKNDFTLKLFQDKHPKIELIDLFEANQYDQTY